MVRNQLYVLSENTKNQIGIILDKMYEHRNQGYISNYKEAYKTDFGSSDFKAVFTAIITFLKDNAFIDKGFNGLDKLTLIYILIYPFIKEELKNNLMLYLDLGLMNMQI